MSDQRNCHHGHSLPDLLEVSGSPSAELRQLCLPGVTLNSITLEKGATLDGFLCCYVLLYV